MLTEQTTTYAYKLKYLDNPTFDKVRGFAKKFIDDLPKELIDELYSQLERGVVQIDSEPQMLVYLYSFGNMHQAKLNVAFENIPPIFFEQPEINIIDYGCGQAIGSMCYADFLSQKGFSQKVKKVTLIEPSEICLKRATLHVSKFCPDAEIVTVNKEFDDLSNNDIACDEEISTLHILSNVLDLEFDLGNFAQVISDNLKGYNQFVCVGPYFNMPSIDRLMDDFAGFFFEGKDNFNKIFDKYQLNTDKSWTAHIRCFSVGELEEDLSTEVTEDDIKNGVEDEYGVVYSKDGKRLLKCRNYELEEYVIKDHTLVVCDEAFHYGWIENLGGFDAEVYKSTLKNITIPFGLKAIGKCAFLCQGITDIYIPDTVTFIGDGAFSTCFGLSNVHLPNSIKSINRALFCKCSLQSINIPKSVVSIGDYAFRENSSLHNVIIPNNVISIGSNAFLECKSLVQIIIPKSVTSIGESAFWGCESLQQIIIPNSVMTIGKYAFKECVSLQQIIIPEGCEAKFKQMLPKELWDKLYYLKKAIEQQDNNDLPF
jgi:hypothetical protein